MPPVEGGLAHALTLGIQNVVCGLSPRRGLYHRFALRVFRSLNAVYFPPENLEGRARRPTLPSEHFRQTGLGTVLLVEGGREVESAGRRPRTAVGRQHAARVGGRETDPALLPDDTLTGRCTTAGRVEGVGGAVMARVK